MAGGPSFEFGPFRLEPEERRLSRDGQPIAMTPKALDLLAFLVAHPDRLLRKDELMEHLWPGVFVEDVNLAQNISAIRRALGGDHRQSYIQTVPGAGYRFVAPLRRSTDDAGEAAAAEAAPERAPSPRRRRATVAGLALLATLTLVTMWLIRRGVWPGAGERQQRLVVLPFENLTRNAADDWLAGGFSDSLTFGLRDVHTLTLVNRERVVEIYRERQVTEAATLDPGVVRELTARLRAPLYVHGTYQRVGDRIRVVARLVDAESGQIRAQESVTDTLENLLKVEDQLAHRFAAALAGDAPVGVAGTTLVEAYRAFSEARTLYAARELPEAEARVTQALAADPRYARAWALLSKIHSRALSPLNATGEAVDVHRETAIRAARRAIELDPVLYDARVALALAYRDAHQTDGWRAEARTAVQLNAREAEAYELLGDSYAMGADWGCARDHDTALAEQFYRTAIRNDPSFMPAYNNLAATLYMSNRIDESLNVTNDALAVKPDDQGLRARQVFLLVELHRPLPPDARTGLSTTSMAGAYTRALIDLSNGDRDVAWREFDAADRRLLSGPPNSLNAYLGYTYLRLGEPRRAIALLEPYVASDHSCADLLAALPVFARFRATPEFAAFLARAAGR